MQIYSMIFIIMVLAGTYADSLSQNIGYVPSDSTAISIDYKPSPTLYSLGYMGAGLGLLCIGGNYTPRWETFKSAYSKVPEWENDPIIFNYILHPLWGSETYLRARENNYSALQSIGFSMGASIAWEYVVESWIKHPSVPDLIFTTGIGWLIGEARYALKQNLSSKHDWWIDPLYTVTEKMRIMVLSGKRPEEKITTVNVSMDF